MSGEVVTVDSAQLDELVASVQQLTERVGNLLDTIAPPPAEPDPAAPLPGFQIFRNRQGGQRG